jgi:2-succinyl-5-enolpyruvyl-6-hydroxy-3-cyclohexene-1-carboxylate synthase
VDPTNRNTALASAFTEELARGGLRQATVSPGSRSTPLALALWRQPEIEVTVILDERSAAFFALGAAQAGDAPVAMLCTSGTAAANFHPAICEADESGLPLIALSADRPPELREIGAGQTIDQLKLYGSSVRWFCEVGNHEADDQGLLHLRSLACRALAAARGEVRPGPVHLNFAWREPLAPVRIEGAVSASDRLALDGRPGRPLTAVGPLLSQPSELLLEELTERIDRARTGVIVAGRQLDPGLREPLASLAQRSNFPILAEPTSQLRSGPHDRSHVVTTYDLLLRDRDFAEQSKPELVLRFGEMPTSKPLRAWLVGSGAEQIVIDPRARWNEPTRRAATLIRADPRHLAEVCAASIEKAKREGIGLWLRAERAAREAIDSELNGASSLHTEPALHLALGRAHSDGDLVYTASSMPIRDQESFLAAEKTDALFLCNRGANGIDGLISSAIGAAHASRRPTTVITGDLGLLHDIGGLAALREVTCPVRIVVIDNDGGGIFDFLPQAQALGEREFESLLRTPRGLDLAKAADLFALPHRRVETAPQLNVALGAGTGLIEVKVERSNNVALHRRLSAAVAASLSL